MKRTEILEKVLKVKGFKAQVYYASAQSVGYDKAGYYMKREGADKDIPLGYSFQTAHDNVLRLKPVSVES